MASSRRSRVAAQTWRWGGARSSRLAIGLLLLIAAGLVMPAPAGAAASFPFAFLVEDGEPTPATIARSRAWGPSSSW